MTITITQRRKAVCPTSEELAAKHVSARPSADKAYEGHTAAVGRIDLSKATARQAAKLLETDTAHVEAVLRERFQHFEGGQYRYDVRFLYALKTGTDCSSFGRARIAEARRRLRLLASTKVPAPDVEGEPIPYSLVANVFADPPAVPRFDTEEDAAAWLRVRAYDEITAAPAEAIRKGFTCEVIAARRPPKRPFGGGKPYEYGVTLRMTVGSMPQGTDVRSRRKDILAGLFGCRDDIVPQFGFAAVFTPEDGMHTEDFRKELERRYALDPSLDLWFRRELEALGCEASVHGLLEKTDLLPNVFRRPEDETALRSWLVFFGNQSLVTQAVRVHARPEDPHRALPKRYAVNDEAWSHWTARSAKIVCRKGVWIRKFTVEEAVSIFGFQMERFSQRGQPILWRAKSRNGKWFARSDVKEIEKRFDESGISVTNGRLMHAGEVLTPAELFAGVAEGRVSELPEFATTCDWPSELSIRGFVGR